MGVSARADGTGEAVGEYLSVNCGRCGKALLVRFEDLMANRTVDCEDCRSV
jgi:DNA-directed RNA polymerase subunit RPC12/RpoP